MGSGREQSDAEETQYSDDEIVWATPPPAASRRPTRARVCGAQLQLPMSSVSVSGWFGCYAAIGAPALPGESLENPTSEQRVPVQVHADRGPLAPRLSLLPSLAASVVRAHVASSLLVTCTVQSAYECSTVQYRYRKAMSLHLSMRLDWVRVDSSRVSSAAATRKSSCPHLPATHVRS